MSLNHDRLKQTKAEGSRTGQGWKTKENDNFIRVLPPHSRYLNDWAAMTDVSIQYEMHFFRIEGQQFPQVSRCLKDLKLQCPACDTYWAHHKSGDPGLKQLADQVRSARVYLMNVLDINNLAAGVQHWKSNYTCWNAILDMAANADFGNILDPANGVNLIVSMTPKSKSRTGFPQYTVAPERDGGAAGPVRRTTVSQILAGMPDWQQKMDALENEVEAAKKPEEIMQLLADMGFPIQGYQRRRPVAGAAPNATLNVAPSAPSMFPTPGPAVVQPTQQSPTVLPISVTPPAVGIPGVPQPVGVPGVPKVEAPHTVVQGFAAALPLPTAHYDPGPRYTPVVPESEHPKGAPRCFGDYKPKVHQCQPCQCRGDCQSKMLGVA